MKPMSRNIKDWGKVLILLLDEAVVIIAILLLLRFFEIHIPLPIMIVVFGVIMGYDLDIALGTFSWQSLMTSTWESIACLSIIISLAYVFKNRFDTQGRLIKWMSPNFYAVYILHSLVIVLITIPFLYIPIPTALKFFFVALISVPMCFVISDLIRKIPYTKRVLG